MSNYSFTNLFLAICPLTSIFQIQLSYTASAVEVFVE